jgi:translocation and assembly module TamA
MALMGSKSHVVSDTLLIQAPGMRRPAGWLFVVMLAPAIAAGGKLTLTFNGLPRGLDDPVRAGLALAEYLDRDLTAAQLERLLRSSESEIRRALEPFGYYDAKVTRQLEREADRFRVTFNVDVGEPVIVTASHVSIQGSAAEVPEVKRALEAFVPRIGATLDHRRYEHSKTAISNALSDVGYLSASLHTHRVEVRRSARSATIDLRWDAGRRYRFGPVRFPDTPLSDQLLARMIPWKEGDPYSAEKLLEFQGRLVEADYFSLAIVQPQPDDSGHEEVPVAVHLTPARRDVRGAGIYGSTDTGFGVKAELQRRWLNASGHKLQAEGEYAEKLQAASLSYRMPYSGPDERTVSFGTTYHDETTDSVREETAKLVWNVTRKRRGLTRMLGLQLISGDFEIGSEHGNSTELFAEGLLARTDSDDASFPRHGRSLTMIVRVAPSNVASRTRFASAEGRGKWIFPSGDHSRLLLRGQLAAMTVADFDELPPELRFFAGGDRSIRGFDYEALGSRNDVGDVIGGTYLAVGSGEYERYFGKKWGIAAFVDAGDAFLTDDFDWNVGVGLGARWKSPVGVVRVDVAYPAQTELDQTFRVHVSIGPDL